MGVNWTTEQQQVIDLRESDILVSAAAGSGKTAVLVERILKRITDPVHPVDIDRLLVVTFTKAAAAEMRERISDAIEKRREEFPEDTNLLRQSSLIHNAMITTIDSFCLFVVRNHFEEIHMDPNFRIADEGEIKLLEKDVLDEFFEKNYEKEDHEAFLQLVDTYSGKRSDQDVKDMVLKIYHMSNSSPWPKKWILGLAKAYQAETAEELIHSGFIQELVENAKQLISDMREQLLALHELALEPDGPAKYASALEQDLALLEEAKDCNDYPALQNFFNNIHFVKLASIKKTECDILKKEAVQNGRNQIKKDLDELKKTYFSTEQEELLAQIKRLRPLTEELVRLSLSYLGTMEEKKKKKRIVDFSDIEHFALRILVDEETKERRETAEEFQAHFDEIMIDEYQDSNQVQEEILSAISGEDSGRYNMFMVGDVKQSIYRFRQSKPELFMEKYTRYTTDESTHQRIDLHKNFRSRKEVIEFSNDMFYKLMHHDLGKVDYDDDAALYCGASYPEQSGMEAEVLLLDQNDELLDGQDELGKKQLEAHMAARRIRRLMKETSVTDKETGQLRPMRYSDIVILFRSLKNWGPEFADILQDYGIPVHVESSTGYFSAIEVQTVLSMLRILDNPYQDIPMAAVLHSLAGLDEEELAQICVEHPGLPFAAAALAAMKEAHAAEDESELARFYEIYTGLRKEKDIPVHELIEKILARTGYGNYASALPAGERRAANLYMLIEKAIAYEKTSYKGLFHFVRYIDQLQKYEIDFGEADVTGENANVVHIMTIHKSKGLEFPVVFVSGISKEFNKMDSREKLVLHPELGIGIHEIERKPRMKRQCLLHAVIADRIRQENLGEELRILYVALTRAKEKLILTGLISDKEKTVSKYTGNRNPKKPISYLQRVNAKGYSDWLLPAVLSYPEKYELQFAEPEEMVWEELVQKEQDIWNAERQKEAIENANEEWVARIAEQFAYQYPYQNEAGRKSKYSVSELKHASMLRQYDREENEAEVPDFLLEEKEPYIPDFARVLAETTEGVAFDTAAQGTTDTITVKDTAAGTNCLQPSSRVNPGALRGTAVHRVMECLDFVALASVDRLDTQEVREFVRKELKRMKQSGELAIELQGLVIPSMLEGFVASPVAGRMADAAAKGELYREKPFVMEYDGVLVQGIIDVFWMEEDQIVLLDYKTDRVKTKEELVLRYETQLKLYADALSRVFSTESKQISAKECLLYSFRLQEVVAI